MRQYIGARYVPKFMGDYDVTQVYEALSVVDNGMGTSYISKIPTPAGTPLTDTTHWQVYGSSSGAIIHLQDQIDDIDNDINSINNSINTLDSTITKTIKSASKKRVVFLSDSYGDTPGEFPDIVNGYIGFEEYYNISAGSIGFTGKENTADYSTDLKFETILYNWVQTQTSDTLNNITDIFVIGGFNDNYTSAISVIDNDISSFITYCKSVLPNASIHVGLCAWCGNGTITTPTESNYGAVFRDRIANKVMIGYSRATRYGASFFELNSALHNYDSAFTSDKYHPDSLGQIRIAMALVNYIMGSDVNIPYLSDTDGGSTTLQISGMTGNLYNRSSLINGMVSLYTSDPTTINLAFNPSSNISANTITSWNTIATSRHFLPVGNTSGDYTIIPVTFSQSGNSYDGYLLIDYDGMVSLYSFGTLTSGTVVRIYGKPFSISMYNC